MSPGGDVEDEALGPRRGGHLSDDGEALGRLLHEASGDAEAPHDAPRPAVAPVDEVPARVLPPEDVVGGDDPPPGPRQFRPAGGGDWSLFVGAVVALAASVGLIVVFAIVPGPESAAEVPATAPSVSAPVAVGVEDPPTTGGLFGSPGLDVTLDAPGTSISSDGSVHVVGPLPLDLRASSPLSSTPACGGLIADDDGHVVAGEVPCNTVWHVVLPRGRHSLRAFVHDEESRSDTMSTTVDVTVDG